MNLIFQNHPDVVIATNTFRRVPVILKYDDTPLIEVITEQAAGYTTKFNIYNADGVSLAVVKGSRIFLTDDGKKAGVSIRHLDKLQVCELGGKTLYELKRDEAAALHTSAELYTPTGIFIRCTDDGVKALSNGNQGAIQIGGVTMSRNTISGFPVGIHVWSDGSVAIGSR